MIKTIQLDLEIERTMDQTIVARLRALRRNKKIACPTCNERLIQPDGDRYDVFDTLEGTTIIVLRHRECKGEAKTLFICTRCGKRSKQKSQSQKIVQVPANKCRCPKVAVKPDRLTNTSCISSLKKPISINIKQP